jgi:aflatoxin B1 aldehyde reductase
MEFGRPERESTVESKCVEMVEYFVEKGYTEVDTASLYSGGKSEEIIGNFPDAIQRKIKVATKANPWLGSKLLDKANIEAQQQKSFLSLKTDCVDLYYLHAPDHVTPIEETLKVMHDLFLQRRFKRLGLSNYAAWQVAEICWICRKKGYIMPTVYQGMYNSLTRAVEAELFPCLRHFGISFYAYNPLAGGILTGRYTFSDADAKDNQQESRFFSKDHDFWAAIYRSRFWHKEYFDAVDGVQAALKQAYGEDHDIPLAEAALRWMMFHSKLDGEHGDAVILGASRLVHLKANIASCEKEPLADIVVEAFEKGWENCKKHTPSYFR